jgi:hypothetical protein
MWLAPEQKLPGLLMVIWLIIKWTGRKIAAFVFSLYIFIFKAHQNVCAGSCFG